AGKTALSNGLLKLSRTSPAHNGRFPHSTCSRFVAGG
ncbi:MAG: hypothetical protein ACI855_002333, partial [Myxococcota bacterium]